MRSRPIKVALVAVVGCAAAGLQAQAANLLDNGDFLFFQRGNSFSNVGQPIKVADRWWGAQEGEAANTFTVVTRHVNASGGRNSLTLKRTAGSNVTGALSLFQALTTEQTMAIAGKPIVATVWAAKGADFSGGTYDIVLIGGTGSDQQGSALGNWPGETTLGSASCTPVPAVAPCSLSVTVAASVRQIAMLLRYMPSGVAAGDDLLTIFAADLRLGADSPKFFEAEPWVIAWTRCAAFYEELGSPLTPWNPGPGPIVVGFGVANGVRSGVQLVTAHIRFMPKRIKNYKFVFSGGALDAHVSDPASGVPIYDVTIDESNGAHRGYDNAFLSVKYTTGSHNGRQHPSILIGTVAVLAIDATPHSSFAVDADL